MSEPYALEHDPTGPDLPGEVVVRESPDQVYDALCAEIYLHALECVRRFGDFHLAIGAGPFQERLCQRLMTDPAVRLLPWQRAHVWATCDQPGPRGVSSFMEIVDLLADHAGIPDSRLHLPEGWGDEAVDEYESRLQHALAWREKGHDRLDLAVLSLSPRGAFSGIAHPLPPESQARLVAPLPGENTITMTPRLLRGTRFIACGVVGRDFRHAVGAMIGNEAASTIRPVGGVLRWYLDREACPA